MNFRIKYRSKINNPPGEAVNKNNMSLKKLKNFGLYFITDSRLTRKSPVEDVKAAVRAGVKIVQYREKHAPAKQMAFEAKEIRKICKKNNVLFLINDSVGATLAVDADGVHLGKDDMPYRHARKLLGKSKIIGLSAHSVKDALQNQRLGADYTSIGPIYPTATKKNAIAPIGLEPVKRLKGRLKIPFVAIGGINESNIGAVLEAGAENIAMASALVAKNNVEGTVRKFMNRIEKFLIPKKNQKFQLKR